MEILGGLGSFSHFDTGVYSRYIIQTLMGEAMKIGTRCFDHEPDRYLPVLAARVQRRLEEETAHGRKSFYRPRLNALCYSTIVVHLIKCQLVCGPWPEELSKRPPLWKRVNNEIKYGSFVIFLHLGPRIYVRCLLRISE